MNKTTYDLLTLDDANLLQGAITYKSVSKATLYHIARRQRLELSCAVVALLTAS